MTQGKRTAVWRPQEHPYIEVIDGSPLTAYHPVLHLHEEFEFAWKPHTSWSLLAGETTYTIPADVVVVTSPYLPHKPVVAEGDHRGYVGLRIAPQFVYDIVDRLFPDAGHTPFSPSVTFIQDGHVRIRLHRLHRGLVSNALTHVQLDESIRQLVTTAFSFMIPALAQHPVKQHVVQTVKSFIEAHYQEQISLGQLSMLTNVSASHLNHLFGETIGMPPHAYQLQIRISRAKAFLAQGRPIADVAVETGFASQSHFGVHFKRNVSITPSQYAADVNRRSHTS